MLPEYLAGKIPKKIAKKISGEQYIIMNLETKEVGLYSKEKFYENIKNKERVFFGGAKKEFLRLERGFIFPRDISELFEDEKFSVVGKPGKKFEGQINPIPEKDIIGLESYKGQNFYLEYFPGKKIARKEIGKYEAIKMFE